jgi:hypothetical protein
MKWAVSPVSAASASCQAATRQPGISGKAAASASFSQLCLTGPESQVPPCPAGFHQPRQCLVAFRRTHCTVGEQDARGGRGHDRAQHLDQVALRPCSRSLLFRALSPPAWATRNHVV